MSNKRPPIAINKGKRKSLTPFYFYLLVMINAIDIIQISLISAILSSIRSFIRVNNSKSI